MIEISHVSKRFVSDVQTVEALRDVSLTIEKGQIWGIIGFSGAGKSTLLRMVNALEVPDQGYVKLDGRKLSDYTEGELRGGRKRIGMIFQQFNLLESRTVYENIAIPLRLNHTPAEQIAARVEELLAFVELEGKKDAYPWQLSGGQKQRVGIARALATNPEILLCDEATSALDPDTTESILQLLAQINQQLGITIILVTHQIQVVQRICNRVAVMENGQIVEQGAVLDVFGNPQRPITQRFVRTVIPDVLPESLVADLQQEERAYKLLKLRFQGNVAKENILYNINRRIPVESSVLFAAVTELQHVVLGIFIVKFIGSEKSLAAATEYLDSHEVAWQEVAV
ncbi:ATP-binding cassette domain-containing protein [Selenomonas caprae]|uniref:ATP-binding cassette domain-containing protein n=1 Tax=Selenomonas caprae TaxID=2606905 RepID=A0A5D6WR85_9FIRM|nr:ATP-binding cassette domain-containing protein [Selenomonas caprae]TYZ31071.1 ATP-binding cassette domain-containing protein [Selenomonas caprae]